MTAVLLIIAALIVALLGWVQIVHGLVAPRLEADMSASNNSLAYGHSTDIVVTVRNPSRFPCPLVKGHVELPEGLSHNQSPTEDPHNLPNFIQTSAPLPNWSSRRESVEFVLSLRSRESVTIRISVRGVRRGRQQVQGLTLRISDGFTTRREVKTIPTVIMVTVHPRRIASRSRTPSQNPVGLMTSQRKWSPTSLDWIDMRTYAPGDAVRDITWMASARRGELIVLERATSMSQRLVVLASVRVSKHTWEGHPNQADRIYETTFALIEALSKQGIQCLLYCDGYWRYGRQYGSDHHLVFSGEGFWNSRVRHHLGHLLGSVAAYPAVSLTNILSEIRRTVPPPTQLILVIRYEDDFIRRQISQFRRAGYDVETILVSSSTSIAEDEGTVP